MAKKKNQPQMSEKQWRDIRANCAEFITDDGRRFAWSESNCMYEELSKDGGSFTMMRRRVERFTAILARRIALASASGTTVTLKFATVPEAMACAAMFNQHTGGRFPHAKSEAEKAQPDAHAG